eukprot:CAMPEP_0178547370 /NCGR_PEP_ID=MMETSP0697-20121206/4642_1 /TAXON_ID=265572 /ORGANISM="Extubocellulus spinifer, Strain CCMP396" /LENGTH=112 /DNA_ID=CAMNT_0020180005 /DNA_START=227 /DNA_END=561 /DNA_ORIENTATION=-
MSVELQLYDAITTTPSDSSPNDDPLQGIVAHLGPVQFSPDPDWVGVRLTGSSVGMGRNDGSVQGVRYFDCGKDTGGGEGKNKSGLFVRRAAVRRRELSRLEELRLKRELRSS